MSQNFPIVNLQIYENISIPESFIDKRLNTHDRSNIRYVIIVDLIYLDNIKKSKNFPFCPENKKFIPDNFIEYLKEHVPKPNKPTSKLYLWSDQ